jgi:hypothetical protein
VETRDGQLLLHLRDDVEVDVETAVRAAADSLEALGEARFDDARRLAELAIVAAQGAFLPDLESEWVTSVQRHLDETVVHSLEIASTASMALGHPYLALAHADNAIGRQPLRESAHRCRMRAQLAAGNRAEALASYQHLRRVLAGDLGVDPSAETEDLYIELLSPPTLQPSVGPTRAPPRPTTFVGRTSELELLAECWERTSSRTPHAVLVTGESGIGKSRLLTEAARPIARSGHVVLFADCAQFDQRPLRPIVEAIGSYFAATPDDLQPVLNTSSRDALELVLAPHDGTNIDVTALLLAATAAIRAISASRPIALILDDLDRADDHTLMFVRYAMRRCDDCRLLILGTAACTATGPVFDAVVNAMLVNGAMRRLELHGLTEHDVRGIVREAFAGRPQTDRPSARHLHELTAGNPFLLIELVCAAVDGLDVDAMIPLGVRDYSRRRLDALHAHERSLATLASVAGPCDRDLLAGASGLSANDANASIAALVSAGIFVELDGTLRFAHEVVRRAVDEDQPAAQRRGAHGRLADALESRSGVVADARRIAHHRLAASPASADERSVRWIWQAATAAPPDEALELCRRAEHLVAPADVALHVEAITRRGLAEHAAGHPSAPDTLFTAALRALAAGRIDHAASAALALADTTLHHEAYEVIDAILERRPVTRPAMRRDDCVSEIDPVTFGQIVARRIVVSTPHTVDGAATEAAAHALCTGIERSDGPLRLETRLNLATALHTIATARRDPSLAAFANHQIATAAATLGDVSRTATAIEALSGGAAAGSTVRKLLADHAGTENVVRGLGRHSPRGAAPTATNGISADVNDLLGARTVVPPPGSMARHHDLITAWLDGSTTPAGPHLASGEPIDVADSSLRALLARRRGRAHVVARTMLDAIQQSPPCDQWTHLIGVLAIVAAEIGDEDTVRMTRDALRPFAHLVCGVGYRSFVGPASLHLGRLAAVVGEWDEAEMQLSNAVASLTARRAAPWVCIAQRVLAGALHARGRRSDRHWAELLAADAETWRRPPPACSAAR